MAVVPKDGVESEKSELRAKVLYRRQRHPAILSFLRHEMPAIHDKVVACSVRFKGKESPENPGLVKVEPIRCHEQPWCMECVSYDAFRRFKRAVSKFEKAKPAKAQPRFIHIVQTAPYGPNGEYPEGADWGKRASRDPAKFAKVMMGSLRQLYGDGVGAHFSYQDFGEKGPAKRHPHLDLTLNGWMLKDGKPVHTPRYELGHGGRDKWLATVQARATAFSLNAAIGSMDLGRPTEGVGEYARAMKYQLRELWDVRKLDYSRDQQKVWWVAYTPGNPRTAYSTKDFKAAYAEYKFRLGQWAKKSEGETPRKIHFSMGHLEKNRLDDTMELMGGEDKVHPVRCHCALCETWETVWVDDRKGEETEGRAWT